MVGKCISDDAICREAAKQEIIRRLYHARCQERKGHGNENELTKLEMLMQRMGLSDENRPVTAAAGCARSRPARLRRLCSWMMGAS